MSFIEEVKDAVSGGIFKRKPKKPTTAEEICLDELNKETYENRKV